MQMETWKVKLYIRKYLILNQHYNSLIKYCHYFKGFI